MKIKLGRFQIVRLNHVQEDLRVVDVPASGWLLSWRRFAVIVSVLDQRRHAPDAPHPPPWQFRCDADELDRLREVAEIVKQAETVPWLYRQMARDALKGCAHGPGASDCGHPDCIGERGGR